MIGGVLFVALLRGGLRHGGWRSDAVLAMLHEPGAAEIVNEAHLRILTPVTFAESMTGEMNSAMMPRFWDTMYPCIARSEVM